MKIKLGCLFVLLTLLASPIKSHALVAFNITPSAVSNTFIGTITLQISGIPTGDTVVVQKYGDVVTNGMIATGDVLVQQFNLTDNQAGMVIGGVTNEAVPYDYNSTTGAITAALPFPDGDFSQKIIGQYGFVLSSPAGHFTPITNLFTVTNFPCAQTITGNIVNNGTNIPYASVILFPAPRPGHGLGSPVGGVVANSSGVYSIQVPPGIYVPLPFQSNYVASYSASPVLTLTNGQTITTNLALTMATASISGQIVDANNSSIVLPGLFVPANNNSGFIASGFTDTNGNFTIRVTSGQWSISGDPGGLAVHGYVAYQNGTNVNAGTTGFVGKFYKATSLFYGTVTNNFGNPLQGIPIEAYDNNNGVFANDGYEDANGNYTSGAVGGLGNNDPWQVQVDNQDEFPNDIFSQPAIDQIGGTNLAIGQAVLANFTVLVATNLISGNVKFNGTNVIGAGVNGSATINGVYYNPNSVDTDTNGNYLLNVANGIWDVSLNTGGGNDSLNNILGNGKYQSPASQNVAITNDNGTANFTIQSCSGVQIITTSPLPGAQAGAYYSIQFAGSSCNGNLNWSVNDPQDLPSGLTLYSGGAFNGTPATSGTYNFTVNMNDGSGNSTNESFALIVGACNVQILTTNLPAGEPGIPYYQLLQGSSCNGNLDWSVNDPQDLPSGLQLDSIGELFGTPATNGTYNFSVNVVDGDGNSTNQSLSLTINVPIPLITAPTHTSGGQFQLSLNGNAGNYYTVEYSTNLINWVPLLTTNPPNSQPLYLDFPTTNQTGFYQAYESGVAVSQSDFSFGTGVAGPPVIYVNVTNGVAVIPITRTSGLSSNVCVNYATSDGTAVGGCDYDPASGQLCFDTGVTSNSFFFSISLGCSATNQSATVNLQISDPNGNNVLNAILVIQRPKPVLAIDTNTLTLVVPENCEQYITISNAGPPGSVLNYTVADDGAFSGFLNLNPYVSTFSLASGEYAPVPFSVLDQFATNWIGGTLTTAANIYTPGAANYVKYPISVTIETDQTAAQTLLGTWSGTWSGTNSGPTLSDVIPVSGTWSLTFQQIYSSSPGTLAAVGTITFQGTDYYWDYDDNTEEYDLPVAYDINQSAQFSNTNVIEDGYVYNGFADFSGGGCNNEYSFKVSVLGAISSPVYGFSDYEIDCTVTMNARSNTLQSSTMDLYNPDTDNFTPAGVEFDTYGIMIGSHTGQ